MTTGVIRFSSVLGIDYREELERMLFFNPLQPKNTDGIILSISTYGVPSIVEDHEYLRIRVEGLLESQTLYALDHSGAKPVLAGVMVYVRRVPEKIILLHVAIHEDYSPSGKHSDEGLFLRLIFELRRIAKCLKGVQLITIQYLPKLSIQV
jgi:hypothetical protein